MAVTHIERMSALGGLKQSLVSERSPRSLRARSISLSRPELILACAAVALLLFVLFARINHDATPAVMAQVTVQQGDTLWSLAQTYGDPHEYILNRVQALMKANGLRKGVVLHEGQRLVVPVTNRSAALYYGGSYASRKIAE